MNLLIVTQYFWPEEFRINDLAQGLVARGHAVTVYTGKPNYPKGSFFPGYGFWSRARENHEGVEIVRVPLVPRGDGESCGLRSTTCRSPLSRASWPPCAVGAGMTRSWSSSPLRSPSACPPWWCVRSSASPSFSGCRISGPRASKPPAPRSPRVLKFFERLTRFIYRVCERVLVQSRGFIEPTRRMGVPKERIRYFPNTAESLYHPLDLAEDAAERTALPNGFRVMFAGNIGAAQDFPTILAAAELLRDDPDTLDRPRRRPDGLWGQGEVDRRGLAHCIHLLGRHPVDSMPRWFAVADALLVTLKRGADLRLHHSHEDPVVHGLCAPDRGRHRRRGRPCHPRSRGRVRRAGRHSAPSPMPFDAWPT